jgi:hypothetical protein
MPLPSSRKVPEAIVQLQGQLDQWRSAQKRRTKLPESFWQAAVDLAKQYGVFQTAHSLRLDYMRLKKRLGDSADPAGRPRQAAFVELRPRLTDVQECIIEFASVGRATLRIHWKSTVPPDWTRLLRAWREVEG